MMRVLMVSKPVAPPWHDSSKNLVRDVASHMNRYRAVLMTRPDAEQDLRAIDGLGSVALRRVYPRAGHGRFAPALADQARVLAALMLGNREGLWHFFFAPNPRSSLAAQLAARARRVPTVQTVCSAPLPQVVLSRVLFADRVVVVSRHTERRFLQGGVSPTRLRRIAPAVAPLQPSTQAQRDATRSELGLPIEPSLLVYPGDLEVSHGAERALRVHAALGGDAWLVLACREKTPAASAARQRMQQLAHELGASARVRFLGETPRIHALLAASDLVLLPSEDLYAKMDLPLVLIEAMLLARPVVVLEGTAAAELADDAAALSVAPTIDALRGCASDLLRDTQARAEVGARARALALARYHPSVIAAQYESIYDELSP